MYHASLSSRAVSFLVCALLLQPAVSFARDRSAQSTEHDSVLLPTLDIPYTKYVLANGLTLIVHEDHAAALVAVNIWYHVGSKNEPPGRSGFAHLFEHLMFNGSENYNDDFFKLTQKIGATEQNGTTSEDRTNYFQTVPKGALDTILWLESDRMGHLLGAIDQARLDEQRKVVQNEKRQGDNEPYAKSADLIIRATTPLGHPYDHSVIGSMEDLNAASLDDVKDWFRTYYGPSNAVVVLSGDVTPAEAREKVEKYFGDIPPGTPVSHPQSWVIKRAGTQRETAYDRVAQPRIYRVWNITEYTSPETDLLQFVAMVLTGDKSSPLYKRLVEDEQLATDVSAEVSTREIAGQFQISVNAKAEKDLPRIEKIIDEELRALIEKGPSAALMNRLKLSTIASTVRSLESISGKASMLAESQTYYGRPDGWKAGYEHFKKATPADLQAVAKQWLTDGDYVLTVLPFGELTAPKTGADRKSPPMPGDAVAATFPAVERATLSNGIKLVVAHRTGVPLVSMTMLFNTGTPEDFATIAPGTGSLAMSLMNEGTTRRTGAQLVEALGDLGATLSAAGGGEMSSVKLSSLTSTLPRTLALYAEVITTPAFPEKELERLKSQTSSSVAAQRQDPSSAARRILPNLIYGSQSAYGRLVTPETVSAIGRKQVVAFHDRWIHPNNATLVVAGDTTLDFIKPLIEAAFANWKAAPVPPTTVPIIAGPKRTVIYLMDRPGTPQAVITAALVAPPQSEGDEIARQLFNTTLGGAFTSRLNMKLREEKGWAYGASSRIGGTGRGTRLFTASASVQTDKAAQSMNEINTALKAITADRKIQPDELTNAKDDMTLGLSSAWSTSSGVGQYLMDLTYNRLPEDYYLHYGSNIKTKTLDDVNAAATQLIGNCPPTWIVAGDLSKVEADIRKLNLGEVRIIDAEGNTLR